MARWFCKRSKISDETVGQAVRTKLGMLSRHADRIEIIVRDGVVTLQGPISSDELHYLPQILLRVPGVRKLRNRLRIYHSDDDIPDDHSQPRSKSSLPRQNRLDKRSVLKPGRLLGRGLRLWGIGAAVTATAAGMQLLSILLTDNTSQFQIRTVRRQTRLHPGA